MTQNATEPERQKRLRRGWAQLFEDTRQRDQRTFVVWTALLAINTFLLVLVVT